MEKILTGKTYKPLLIFLFLTGGFFGVFSPSALAAAPELTLSPSYTEIVLDQTKPEASFAIELKNNGLVHQTFAVSVIDFGSLDESGGVAFLGAQKTSFEVKYGLASWLILDKNFLQVAPNGSDRLNVTITNKDSLSPGGHYAAVVLRSDSETENNLGNITFNYALSSLVFVKKTGGEITGLELIRPKLTPVWFSFPQKLDLQFKNTGNIHLVPRGEIVITDPVKRLVSRGIINPESGIILPESIRHYFVDLKSVSPSVLPGIYQVRISFRFDGQATFTDFTGSFFYLGLPFIGSLLAAVVIPIILYLFTRKRRTKPHA